jgi:2-polyprenyl-3-methyl-5-hydroxy-6-metoxy-1,4-benzoquinol methylase
VSNFSRTLLGPTPWLIEQYAINGDVGSLSGWALTPDGDVENWCFLINGRTPETVYPLPTPSLERVFPFCFGSGRAGFTLEFQITRADRDKGLLEIVFANRYTRLPTSDYFNQYIDLEHERNLRIPGDDQLFRTQGNRSSDRYRLHGFTTFKRIERALYRHSGRSLQDFNSILDWGCGAGRLTQQLALHLRHFDVHGIDIDESNVAWCQANIPACRFDVVPLCPPTALRELSYDLVIGISVLTHLDEPTQHAWLRELQRVTKPAGYLLLTTHGESALARVKNTEVVLKTLKVGIDTSTPDPSLDKVITSSDYYRSSYHLRSHVSAFLNDYFDVIEIIPGGNASLQDLVVLRRRRQA